jgi:hypothetical protein
MTHHTVILTVADHEANGFVYLARMLYPTEEAARAYINQIDATVDDDAEPDKEEAPYWFLLDLHAGDSDFNCIDNSRRRLPTQIARQIAPDRVDWWMSERPDPNAPKIYGAPIHRKPAIFAEAQP